MKRNRKYDRGTNFESVAQSMHVVSSWDPKKTCSREKGLKSTECWPGAVNNWMSFWKVTANRLKRDMEKRSKAETITTRMFSNDSYTCHLDWTGCRRFSYWTDVCAGPFCWLNWWPVLLRLEKSPDHFKNRASEFNQSINQSTEAFESIQMNQSTNQSIEQTPRSIPEKFYENQPIRHSFKCKFHQRTFCDSD